MTPKERATDICRRAGWTIEPWVYDIIVVALNAAITEERERCAQIVEACTCAGINDIWPAAQRAIAEDIRTRGEPS